MRWWPGRPEGRDTPLAKTVFVVFDLEMTGLDPRRDAIVAFGAVLLRGGRIVLGRTFDSLVRPDRTVRAESVRIHRLTPQLLAGQPDIEAVLPGFLDFLTQGVPAGWNTGLDEAFLVAACARSGLAPPPARFLDVLHLYRAVRGGRGSHLLDDLPVKDVTLYSVARVLGIAPKGAHTALGDAAVTAQVLQRLLAILGASVAGGDPSLETILRLADPDKNRRLAPMPAF